MSTAKIYGKVAEKVFSGLIDFTTDTIKCAFLGSGYTPNQDTDEFWSGVSANEVAGTGYTAGGATVTTVTLTYNAGTNTLKVDADDPAWVGATLTGIRYAVFYKDTGSGATSPLISFVDFITDQAVTSSTITVAIPVAGILSITVA
jgi:hypothetical protein